MSNLPNPTRRALLRGRPTSAAAPVRPPWTREARLADGCTRCRACIAACPENVLVAGVGGFPALDVRSGSGECTFCAACVEACPAPVFDLGLDPPLAWRASVGEDCLPARGVACESCRDACPEAAIRFAPRLGGPAEPAIRDDRCTGCGACVGVCPAAAVRLVPRHEGEKGKAA